VQRREGRQRLLPGNPSVHGGALVRLAAYNVENLFDRAKAMSLQTWAEGRWILERFARLSELLGEPGYAAVAKAEMVRLMIELGLETSDTGPYVILRRNRGGLLRRPRAGGIEVIADGRADWVGSLELRDAPIDERAMRNTARVLIAGQRNDREVPCVQLVGRLRDSPVGQLLRRFGLPGGLQDRSRFHVPAQAFLRVEDVDRRTVGARLVRAVLEAQAERVFTGAGLPARLGAGVGVDAEVPVQAVHAGPGPGLAHHLNPGRNHQEAGAR
jgi:hypothetical protein